MGKGIDAARPQAPEHAALLEDLKENLLIAFMRRLGGSVSMPASEIDDVGGYVLSFSVVDGVFNFKVSRKQ